MDTKHLNDIIELCKRGEKQGREELFQLYSPKMLAICYRYVGSQDAEDVMIDGFIRVYENINSYTPNNFSAWIARIMTNTCLAFLKKETKFNLLNTDYYNAQEQDMEIDNPIRFTKQDLLNAITSLPNSYRTIFNLSVVDGYTHDEICEILHIEKQTVKTALYRAKLRLKDYLLQLEQNK